jgi:ACS family hexuronate transporter-like MFS transporter
MEPLGPRAGTGNLRWWIAAIIFSSMVINYIDRQTFNALSPYISRQYGWTYAEFGTVLIAFRIAYTVMQALSGRLVDRVGTRRGLAVSVSFYSLMAVLTAAAQTLWGFRAVRFGLGAGEAANWPAAIKASSEWFPAKERAWAVALFDSGTAVGGFLAPFLALALYTWFGDWRPVCVVTGSMGALWVVAWLACYEAPSRHRHMTPRELDYIQQGSIQQGSSPGAEEQEPPATWRRLLSYRQTWGIMLGRFLFDPYWFFVGEWFPLFLRSRGFSIEQSVLGLAAPLAASVFGNFAGGALSSHLIRRGWGVGRSRRTVLALFGPSMMVLALSLLSSNYLTLLALFSYANFAYAACSTMFLSLPADAFHPRAVASASGLGGTAAGAGTLLSTYWIGQMADQYSFGPVVLAASLVPSLAVMVFVALVRAPTVPDQRRLALEF